MAQNEAPPGQVGQQAASQAATNNAQAGSFSNASPNATACCQKELVLGVFFDGTGNNMHRDEGRTEDTNVAKLYRVYREDDDAKRVREKLYVAGVGTALGGASGDELVNKAQSPQDKGWANTLVRSEKDVPNSLGLAGGFGATERIRVAYRWALAWCKKFPPEAKKYIDVYGFSRGAMMARTFVNLINKGMKKVVQNVQVRFLGVFDTVGSFGSGGDDSEPGQNPHIALGDAMFMEHFTAKHEIRKNFPLTAMRGADREYPGVHSDVGGGYAAEEKGKVNHLALVPLQDMWTASKNAGVEMNALSIPSGVNMAALRADIESESFEDGPNREKYVHNSATGGIAHSPEPSGKRRVFHPNKKKDLKADPPAYEWDS
jgi:uncharacterized protein (DUF2235 family)